MDPYFYPPRGSVGLSFEKEARCMRPPSETVEPTRHFSAVIAGSKRREEVERLKKLQRGMYCVSILNPWFFCVNLYSFRPSCPKSQLSGCHAALGSSTWEIQRRSMVCAPHQISRLGPKAPSSLDRSVHVHFPQYHQGKLGPPAIICSPSRNLHDW